MIKFQDNEKKKKKTVATFYKPTHHWINKIFVWLTEFFQNACSEVVIELRVVQ